MTTDKEDRQRQVASGVSRSGGTEEDEGAGKVSPPAEGPFGLAFANAPMGMAIFGLDYRLRRANKALCRMLGYSQRELLEHTLLDLAHPDDRKKERELCDRLLRGEIPICRLPQRSLTKDGRQVWLDMTAVLVGGLQQVPLYGLAMIEDVTERKHAQEALRASEERYRSFIVNSTEGIWRFEAERPIDTSLPPEEQLQLLYDHGYLAECNDAMARMYGHGRAEELIGANFQTLRSALSPALRDHGRQFVENGYRLLDAESVGSDVRGRERLFSSNIIGIVVNGYLLRLWGTQRDETERKHFEAQLQGSRRQMRSLVARLQSLVEIERAAVAREMHDALGQGLTSLKMDISWLGKRLPGAGAEGVRAEMAARLGEMTALLERTIAAVKNISTELRPSVLDKFGLPAAIEWQCQEFARRTGLHCQYQLPDDDPPLKPEHSIALFRILQEALTNVARHAGARDVRVGLRSAHGSVTLTVWDDGRGITGEELSSPAALGLLGMRERAEALGGSLRVGGGVRGGTLVEASVPFACDEIRRLKAI